MMRNQHRQFITPVGMMGPPSSSNKRKERDDLDVVKPSSSTSKPFRPSIPRPGPISPAPKPKHHHHPEPPLSGNNRLLAGYLAHEFLTKGTLFGEPWDPARAEAVPVSADSRRLLKQQQQQPPSCSGSTNQKAKAEPADSGSAAAEPRTKTKTKTEEHQIQRYVEVSNLLKTDGAHLPGIVNPSQLARFLKL